MSNAKLIQYMKTLEELDELRESDRLSDEEYSFRRGRVLAEMNQFPAGRWQVKRELLEEERAAGAVTNQEYAQRAAEIDLDEESDTGTTRLVTGWFLVQLACGGILLGLVLWLWLALTR